MISKELLSVVLRNYGITDVYPSYDESDVVTAVQYEIEEIVFEINIYELAHECKKWAYDSHNMMMRTNYAYTIEGTLCRVSMAEVCTFSEKGVWFYSTCANTEPEAIIKATSYIARDKGLL